MVDATSGAAPAPGLDLSPDGQCGGRLQHVLSTSLPAELEILRFQMMGLVQVNFGFCNEQTFALRVCEFPLRLRPPVSPGVLDLLVSAGEMVT